MVTKDLGAMSLDWLVPLDGDRVLGDSLGSWHTWCTWFPEWKFGHDVVTVGPLTKTESVLGSDSEDVLGVLVESVDSHSSSGNGGRDASPDSGSCLSELNHVVLDWTATLNDWWIPRKLESFWTNLRESDVLWWTWLLVDNNSHLSSQSTGLIAQDELVITSILVARASDVEDDMLVSLLNVNSLSLSEWEIVSLEVSGWEWLTSDLDLASDDLALVSVESETRCTAEVAIWSLEISLDNNALEQLHALGHANVVLSLDHELILGAVSETRDSAWAVLDLGNLLPGGRLLVVLGLDVLLEDAVLLDSATTIVVALWPLESDAVVTDFSGLKSNWSGWNFSNSNNVLALNVLTDTELVNSLDGEEVLATLNKVLYLEARSSAVLRDFNVGLLGGLLLRHNVVGNDSTTVSLWSSPRQEATGFGDFGDLEILWSGWSVKNDDVDVVALATGTVGQIHGVNTAVTSVSSVNAQATGEVGGLNEAVITSEHLTVLLPYATWDRVTRKLGVDGDWLTGTDLDGLSSGNIKVGVWHSKDILWLMEAWNNADLTSLYFVDSRHSDLVLLGLINTSDLVLSVLDLWKLDPVLLLLSGGELGVLNEVADNWSTTVEGWLQPANGETLSSGTGYAGRVDLSWWVDWILHEDIWSGFGWLAKSGGILGKDSELVLDVGSQTSHSHSGLSAVSAEDSLHPLSASLGPLLNSVVVDFSTTVLHWSVELDNARVSHDVGDLWLTWASAWFAPWVDGSDWIEVRVVTMSGLVDGAHSEHVLLITKQVGDLGVGGLELIAASDPSEVTGLSSLNNVVLNVRSTVVEWFLPTESSSLGSDVVDLEAWWSAGLIKNKNVDIVALLTTNVLDVASIDAGVLSSGLLDSNLGVTSSSFWVLDSDEAGWQEWDVVVSPFHVWLWSTGNMSFKLNGVTSLDPVGFHVLGIKLNLWYLNVIVTGDSGRDIRELGHSASSVSCTDSELVAALFGQTRNGEERIGDVAEVTLQPSSIWNLSSFNDVASNLGTAIEWWFTPGDGDVVSADIVDFWLAWRIHTVSDYDDLGQFGHLGLTGSVFSANSELEFESVAECLESDVSVSHTAVVSLLPHQVVSLLLLDVVGSDLVTAVLKWCVPNEVDQLSADMLGSWWAWCTWYLEWKVHGAWGSNEWIRLAESILGEDLEEVGSTSSELLNQESSSNDSVGSASPRLGFSLLHKHDIVGSWGSTILLRHSPAEHELIGLDVLVLEWTSWWTWFVKNDGSNL